MSNSFLQAFINERTKAESQQQKSLPIPVKPIAGPKSATKDPMLESKPMSIREFAKSKPSGKDVEKWFREKVEALEAQSDSD